MITVPYEVKKALRDGMLRKNYRFVVLNDDGTEDFTIDNDTLVSESVSIDERMCSGDTLKFGLCEGSSLDFQYFMPEKGQYEANKTYMRNDLVHSNGVAWRSRTDNNTGNPLVEGDYWAEWVKPNITGRRVQVFVDVLYELSKWQKKADLESVFLENYECLEDGLYKVFISAEEASKISYAQRKHGSAVRTKDFVLFSDGHKECEIECNEGDKLYIIPYSYANIGQGEIFLYNPEKWHSIPMGFFDVKKCSRQASTGIIKAMGYNKLQSEYLDAKANLLIDDIPSDGGDGMLTLYTIKKALLEDYTIDYYEESIIEVTQTPSYQSRNWNSPSVDFQVSGNTKTWHPQCLARSGGWIQTPTYSRDEAYLIFKQVPKYIEMLEDIVSQIKTAIYSQVVSPDALWQAIRGRLILTASASAEVYGYGNQYIYFTCPSLYEFKNEIPNTEVRLLTDLQALSDVDTISFAVPTDFEGYRNISSSSIETITICSPTMLYDLEEIFEGQIAKVDMSTLTSAELIRMNPKDMPDVTLRDLISASYETVCQFGQLSRTTDLFSGVELNHSRLYPADSLYPATDLYPDGAAVSGFKSMYSKLWADEGNVHKWRYLIITYKGLDGDGNETDYTLQRTINNDGTDDYNMSDNWLFRNLIWTAEQVAEYADAMIAKMQDVTWFPFEMWLAGLPYLETGDQIEIPLNGEVYTSYVLQRQLKGIQNLQDTYINGTLDIF